MLKSENLDGIKLVDENYIATDGEALTVLEHAVQQGSQGWGIRREEGVILKFARDLKIALALAATADELARRLKGEQLSHGRTKAALSKVLKELDELKRDNLELDKTS